MSNIAKFWKWLLKTDEDIGPQSREILQTFVWWGPAQTCFPSTAPSLPHHVQRSVDFHNFAELYLCTLKTYRFQIWQFYSHWNYTKIKFKRYMKTTRRLSVSASYVWEVQSISFLYCCDVIEMIVRTHKKNNKIEQEQEVNRFLRLWTNRHRVISTPLKCCSFLTDRLQY